LDKDVFDEDKRELGVNETKDVFAEATFPAKSKKLKIATTRTGYQSPKTSNFGVTSIPKEIKKKRNLKIRKRKGKKGNFLKNIEKKNYQDIQQESQEKYKIPQKQVSKSF